MDKEAPGSAPGQETGIGSLGLRPQNVPRKSKDPLVGRGSHQGTFAKLYLTEPGLSWALALS